MTVAVTVANTETDLYPNGNKRKVGRPITSERTLARYQYLPLLLIQRKSCENHLRLLFQMNFLLKPKP